MDPTLLANSALAILTPYLAKAGGALADEALRKLPEGADKLWSVIQARFKGRPAAEGAAQELAARADDADNQEAFSLQLKKALKEDPAFAGQLAALIAPSQAPAQSTSNTGSGAAASGGGVAAGAGGIAIGGNVGGSVVFGNNNTVDNRRSDAK